MVKSYHSGPGEGEITMATVCDACYMNANEDGWDGLLTHMSVPAQWEFQLCDLCRRMLRDVIFVVLHKVTHGELLMAVQKLMEEKGLTYDDLMKFGKDQIPTIEGPRMMIEGGN